MLIVQWISELFQKRWTRSNTQNSLNFLINFIHCNVMWRFYSALGNSFMTLKIPLFNPSLQFPGTIALNPFLRIDTDCFWTKQSHSQTIQRFDPKAETCTEEEFYPVLKNSDPTSAPTEVFEEYLRGPTKTFRIQAKYSLSLQISVSNLTAKKHDYILNSTN